MPKLTILLFIIAVIGCSAPKKERVYQTTSFEHFHRVKCEIYIDSICIGRKVGLTKNQVMNLISIAETKNNESLRIAGVRYNGSRSTKDKSKVIEVVFGKYNTVNGVAYDGIEEVSTFREHKGNLIHIDTVVVLYDPF